MGFLVKKKFDLAFLGDGWSGAYIIFSALTFKESRGFANQQFDEENPQNEANLNFVIELLQAHFIEGKAYNGNDLVDLSKDDLEELPVDVITQAVELLVGGPSSNLQTT